MAERVVLHVGTPKSGTTYLQTMIWENRTRLAEAGVQLPLNVRRDHFQAAGDLLGSARRVVPGVPPTTWPDMVAALHETPGTALISEELLSSLDAEARERVLDTLAGTPLTILVTGRDPIRQLPSVWQQRLKHGSAQTIAEFSAAVTAGQDPRWFEQQDLADMLGRWTDLLGPEAVRLVTVPPRGADPRLLWERFATALGIAPDGYAAPVTAANETLDRGQAELLRRVNAALAGRLPFPDLYVPVIRLRLVPALMGHPLGGPLTVPAEHEDWLTAYGEDVVARVEEMGVTVVGDLRDLVGTMPAAAGEPWDESVLDRVLLDVLADFAVAQATAFEEINGQRERINRQAARIDRLQAKLRKARSTADDLATALEQRRRWPSIRRREAR